MHSCVEKCKVHCKTCSKFQESKNYSIENHFKFTVLHDSCFYAA